MSEPLKGQYGKHTVQLDVEDFHRVVVGIPDSEAPAIRRPELRASLIEEEARETIEAIRRGDLVEAIDGMCDVLCVIYGTAAEFGIDLAPFWDEVHRTNMAKAGGPIREDGKRLKPEGWTPPDIAGLLKRVQADSGFVEIHEQYCTAIDGDACDCSPAWYLNES